MPAVIVLGAQWGDEGKGKATDQIGQRTDYVVKFNGGNNAGHTVVVDGQKYTLHLLPAGILSQGVTPVIASGVVVDLDVLFDEVEEMEARGVDCSRLLVSANAHIIPPYNRLMDQANERARSRSTRSCPGGARTSAAAVPSTSCRRPPGRTSTASRRSRAAASSP